MLSLSFEKSTFRHEDDFVGPNYAWKFPKCVRVKLIQSGLTYISGLVHNVTSQRSSSQYDGNLMQSSKPIDMVENRIIFYTSIAVHA